MKPSVFPLKECNMNDILSPNLLIEKYNQTVNIFFYNPQITTHSKTFYNEKIFHLCIPYTIKPGGLPLLKM